MIQLHYTAAAQYKSRALMHQKEKFLFPISYLDILYYSSLKTRIKKNMADINIATSITAWCDPDWIIQSKNNHFFLIFITHIQDNKIKSIHVSALFMQILSSYFLIPFFLTIKNVTATQPRYLWVKFAKNKNFHSSITFMIALIDKELRCTLLYVYSQISCR